MEKCENRSRSGKKHRVRDFFWSRQRRQIETDSAQITQVVIFPLPNGVQNDFLGRPRKSISRWEKIVDPRFRFFGGRRCPPGKIISSTFLRHLLEKQLFYFFRALRKFHETLLYEDEVRKVPFRVRRPGARIELFPRRN